MEIKLTIEALGLEGAINKLAEAISGHKMPTTVSGSELKNAITQATKEAVKGNKSVEEMSDVEMATPVDEIKTEQTEMDLPTADEEVTIDDLRAMGAKLKAKGIATKPVISEMGFDKLSAIPVERYAEVKSRFDSLLEKVV